MLVEKMDLAIKRYERNRDSLFIVDGSEGDGKTTLAISLGYYIAHKMGKPFSTANIFFDVEKMLKFAATHTEQVIIWDEACTMGMGMSWQNKIQQKLIKVLMMSRKKKHFWFFNIPKIRKLNEYLVDRAVGLVHVYSPDLIKQGYFVYFKRDSMLNLYEWHKERGKKKYNIGYDGRPGTFSNPKGLINEAEYEIMKDQAILDVFKDEKKENTSENELINWLKYKIATFPAKQTEMAKHFGNTARTLSKWKHLGAQVDSELKSRTT